jgi:hypothetical protein
MSAVKVSKDYCANMYSIHELVQGERLIFKISCKIEFLTSLAARSDVIFSEE